MKVYGPYKQYTRTRPSPKSSLLANCGGSVLYLLYSCQALALREDQMKETKMIKSIIKNRILNKGLSRTKRELIKFIIVGLCSTFYNYIAYIILYFLSGKIILASIIGYSVGLLNSYQLGKKWVFRVNSPNNNRLIISFLLVYAIGCFVSSAIIFAITRVYDTYNIAWIIGTAYAVVNNFIGSKFIIFKRD